MRICLYTDTALPKMGGQELVVDALARAYAALGHQPVVLAPWPRKLSPGRDKLPYPVMRHPRFYSTHFLTAWYRWFLQQHYQHHPFDVLHCHGIYPPAYLAALSRTVIPAPVVVTSHGGDVYENNVRLKKPLIRERAAEGLQSADALIAISRFTREGLVRLCPQAARRIVDIPNGVHLSDFAERVSRPVHLDAAIEPGAYAVFFGRLKYRKGVDVLLQALARTPGQERVQLVIAGDGEERATLEIIADQLGLNSRVRFQGKVTGVTKQYLLQNARFGVIPSRQWEAFGLVMLEGYASGLPMIATDMPGLCDLVLPERTGLLVPPESPDALAEAMTRLFADDALIARMSSRASAFVKPFDWQSIAQRHLALYQSLLSSPLSMAA
jgi:glycosyltransferase involved in cell wall biosynthesis